MTKPFHLQSVRDLSHLRLDEATKRLGELVAGHQEADRQLEVLNQYRQEYHAQFLEAARNGIGRDQWRNFQAFLEKLDLAIEQAKQTVVQRRERMTAGQKEWIDKRGQAKAFDNLAQRHRQREENVDQRRQQQSLDEQVARNFTKSRDDES